MKASTPTDVGANQLQGSFLIARWEALQEQVLTLKGAANGAVSRLLERASEAEEEAVPQVEDVRSRMGPKPFNQLHEFLALKALLTSQDRDGKVAQGFRVAFQGPSGSQIKGKWGVPDPIQESRCVAETEKSVVAGRHLFRRRRLRPG